MKVVVHDGLVMGAWRSLLAVSVLVALSACGKQADGSNAATTGMQAGAAADAGGMGSGSGMGGGGGRVTAVVADTVKLTNLADETEALGTAKANEAVDITAKSTNRVVAVHFREGEYVKQGTVLVEFDGAETRANLSSAEATLRDTQSQYQRSRELFQSKALSESDLIQLEAKMLTSKAAVEAAQARVNDTVIRAPFSGRMGLRVVSVGSLVTPGQVISTLDDTSVIKLDFTMPESYLATVKEGQQVEAKSAAYNNQVFRGRVSSIATRVDPVSRSVVVRALIDNGNQALKPGMFMTVHLTRSQGQVVMIPEQALLPESERQFVYVVNNDTASKVQVSVGRRKPGMVEIQQGLKAGDLLVVEGGEKLSDGAKVSVVGAKAAAES
ncbi:MAG: efflux RND transporter periplasmic adaptor subunit [Steroidobacteraceae bacterium]